MDGSVEYREIPNYPGYMACSDGTIVSEWSVGRKPKQTGVWNRVFGTIGAFGYRFICFRRGGLRSGFHRRAVHQLVMEAFVGPKPPGMQCCHNDGNPGNNAIANLRWDTPRGNQLDRFRHGTNIRGEGHASALMTNEVVMDVASRLRCGESCHGIAISLGVSDQAILDIRHGRTWSWLTGASQTNLIGEKFHPRRRLTIANVKEIRSRLAAGFDDISTIAKDYSVSTRNIRAIRDFETWKNVG